MKITSVPLIILTVISSVCCQQTPQDTVFPGIPPLEVILDAALERSFLLKAKGLESGSIYQEMSIKKKKWLDYVFIEGATSYGMFDQVVVNQESGNTQPGAATLTRSEQIRYYGGLGLKLPVSAIASRRNELEIKRLALKKTEMEELQLREELKKSIIDEYFKLLYLQESLKTFQEIFHTLEISYMKAERELLNGRIALSEYALLASTVGKSKDDYFKAKNNFYAQYYKLEQITGMEFNSK